MGAAEVGLAAAAVEVLRIAGRADMGRGCVADPTDRPTPPAADDQGLTLVHFSAQPNLFWSHLHVSPCLIDWGEIMQPTFPTESAYVQLKTGRV